MLEMWDVQDVGCWGCGMFGMWDVPNGGYLGCGVWDIWRDMGC